MSPTTRALPPELYLDIFDLLLRNDLLMLSLASHSIRQLAVPSIFHTIELRPKDGFYWEALFEMWVCMSNDIKTAIQSLTITPSYYETRDQERKFFLILESFSNISSLHFDGRRHRHMRLSDLAATLHAVRNAPLQHLSVMLASNTMIDKSLLSGPTGLKTCTVEWRLHDPDRYPGEAMKYLYAFLEPSLNTLHYLNVLDHDNYSSRHPADIPPPILDFRTLRPACTQIRRFDYHTYTRKTQALATFAEMFPDVEILKVIFDGFQSRLAIWTDECLRSLSLYRNLANLTLSIDFEVAENDEWMCDHDMAWYRRCFFRRFKATKLAAEVCLRLKRCTWIQMRSDSVGHDQISRFIIVDVENRERSSRIVRPVKEGWMVKEFESGHGGDLPEDMVEESWLEQCTE